MIVKQITEKHIYPINQEDTLSSNSVAPLHLIFALLLGLLFFNVNINANPSPDSGPLATHTFGSNPIYSPKIKPSIILNELGIIDTTLNQQQKNEYKKKISEWSNAGIEYAAKYELTNIISQLRYSLSTGAQVNADNSLITGDDSGQTFYVMSPTRQAFQNYLIDAGKTAIDLGVSHIILENNNINFSTLSFDDEIVSEFATYINEPTYDIKTLVIAAGYTKNNQIDINNATLTNDTHWAQWTTYANIFSHNFFTLWSNSLKDYASINGKTITLITNGLDNSINDFALSSNRVTHYLLDASAANVKLNDIDLPEKNYPAADINYSYKIALARGQRFWSWSYPNNTDALDDVSGINNSTNQPANNTDRLFVTQTFANGGLSQISDANKNNFINFDVKPNATVDDYQFIQKHPELFNLNEASEIAIVYGEYSITTNPDAFGSSFIGATYLLSDAHRLWDVIIAADINSVAFKNNVQANDTFTIEKLNEYKTIILPHIQNLSDTQINVIETYLNADASHTIIGFSTNATHTETNTLAATSRTFDDLFGIDATDTTRYTGTVISFANDLGKSTADNANIPATRTTNVNNFNAIVTTSELTTTLPMSTQITRFIDTSDGSHIYHLVNTDVDASTDAITTIASGTTLTVPLPATFSGEPTISFMTPENPTSTILTATLSGNNRVITLPSLGLWSIIKVGSNTLQPIITDNKPWSQIHLYNSILSSIDDIFDYQGNRPDALDSNHHFIFPERYWKSSLNSSTPLSFNIAYLATDDFGISQVEMFYRYSAEYNVWSSWFSAGIISTGINGIDVFTFDKIPYGDGHYQFYTQATDNNGQLEPIIRGAETGYGIDTAAPNAPDAFNETNGIQHGVWQNNTVTPSFIWEMPIDNLSGTQTGWLTVKRLSDNSTIAACDNIDLTTQNNIDLSACSPPLPPLDKTINQQLLVTFQSQDVATNLSQVFDIFELRIGTKTVQDPVNQLAIPINSGIVVKWDTPSDVTNFNEVRVYISPVSQVKNKWDISSSRTISNLTTDNNITIGGLINGVAYRVAIEAFDSNNNLPGDLISVTQSIIPQAFTYGITLNESIESITENTAQPTSIAEGGITDSYSLVLNAPPTTNVKISITNSDQYLTTPSSIIFTPTNWNITQEILITAIDDNFIEETLVRNITHTVTSTDANYNNIIVPDISVTVIDNDSSDAISDNVNTTPPDATETQNNDNTARPVTGKKSFFGCSLSRQTFSQKNRPLDPTLPILILLSMYYLISKKNKETPLKK